MKRHLFTASVIIYMLACCTVLFAQNPSSQPYTWKNAQIVGGGFVDGIVFHPKVKDVRYARTDMGGAYKWNPKISRWEPVMDWVPYEDLNLMGVESIALDPQDTNRVYMACGTYTNSGTPDGAILISKDGAKTFTTVRIPVKFGGNENGRGNGERMMVDPNFSNIIYLGTRHAGLWKSTDFGASWKKVENFPDVTEVLDSEEKKHWWGGGGSGICLVLVDPQQKTKEGSVIYAGVSLKNRDNFFCSKDGGITWNALKGQPVTFRPTHAVISSDGNMFITYGSSPGPSPMNNGAVWKYEIKTESWTEISPVKHNPESTNAFGYAAVSTDAANPDVLIVSSFSKGKDEDEIYRSTDGGKTWKTIFTKESKWDRGNAPYTVHTPLHWMFDVEINPFNPDHTIFTTGYGVWETFNLTDADKNKAVNWSIMSKGIEETVPLDIVSPNSGAQVLVGIGDYCGFRFEDPDKVNPEGCFTDPHMANITSLAVAEKKPEIVIRCGHYSYHKPGKNFGFSFDGGKSWKEPENTPSDKAELGFVTIAADGSSWIWTPIRDASYISTDQGVSWKKVIGIPENTRIIADRVNSKKFYAMDLFGGKLYTSMDGGLSFSGKTLSLPDGLPVKEGFRGDHRGGQDKIYATPEKEGDLWIAAFNGLYHSINAGENFVRIPDVDQIHAFGFGKAAEGSSAPALYIAGKIKGFHAIFRSDDGARSWIRINDNQHNWGLILLISGDPKKYGRVYVGTHGRGLLYGDIK